MKHRLFKTTSALLLGGMLLTLSATAQESKSLTLKEAIDLSLKNSKQLRVNKAQIDAAIAATKEAEEKRLPDASVSGSYLRVNKPDIKLKTGGSGSGDSSSSVPNVNQAMYAMASVSVPLFAGFKIKYGIESAKFLEKAVQLDADNNRQDVVLNTISAFINLYKASKAVTLVEQNLEQSRTRDNDFINLEKNGMLARNELLKAQQETSNLELSLLDAQNNVQLATVNMNLMLGLAERTLLIPDSASIAQPAELKTIEEYEQLATSNRNDVKALDYRRKAAESNVKIAKGDYYPSVALTGGYVALNIPNFVTVTNAVNAGIGVKYNIASLWKANTKIQQAKIQERELEANASLLDDQIRLSINKAYQDYLLGNKKIEVYNKALALAEENYRISNNKYNNALLTLTDLLDAHVAQLQAQLNITFAKADLALAYQTLLQKAGMLNQ